MLLVFFDLSYSCFFFLILRRLPRSTLFPYTTLFRSSRIALHQKGARIGEGSDRIRLSRRKSGGARAGRRHDDLDRKSTRLNSSHTVISYAVFCLKKKKKSAAAEMTTQDVNVRVVV